MKRSEMIRYLAKELKRKDKCVTTNIDQCKYLVEKVLKSCENKGMTPPNQYASTNEFRFEWEPEND